MRRVTDTKPTNSDDTVLQALLDGRRLRLQSVRRLVLRRKPRETNSTQTARSQLYKSTSHKKNREQVISTGLSPSTRQRQISEK